MKTPPDTPTPLSSPEQIEQQLVAQISKGTTTPARLQIFARETGKLWLLAHANESTIEFSGVYDGMLGRMSDLICAVGTSSRSTGAGNAA